MMMSNKLTPEHLRRAAVVYVRQSKPSQVIHHQESKRLQYALVDRARSLGFQQVTVIDDDLGRTGSGSVERPGFERLVMEVCSGQVGAVFCIEASRLARNGRDWHHLIELRGLIGVLVIDPDGMYDPRLPNDRLLLGLKGTMSEFELHLFRQRSAEAILQKARRGELQFRLPIGLPWTSQGKIEIDAMLTCELRRPLPQTIGDVATGRMRAPPRFQFLPCLFYFQEYRCCVIGFHQSVLLALVGQTD
jgi:DNA invertase Pin-like site-specific DNA recombinase